MSKTFWALVLGGFLTSQALAQSTRSESKNFGMSLPSSPSGYGSDEVRAADGTTCRSSMSGNGPKFDMGAIGVPGHSRQDTFSAIYGRVVIPLTRQPRRLDCYSLYQLELERLKHELEMAKGTEGDEFSDDVSGNWSGEDWSDEPPEEGAENTVNPAQADDVESDAGGAGETDVQEDTEVENDAEVKEEALAPLGSMSEAPLGYMPETVDQWTLRGMMD